MKGLLIKDYCLLKSQKQFLMMVFIICMAFLIIYKDPSFVVAYMMVLFSFLTLSTLSYDEFDNGMSFMFTLPVSRSIYVKEKYLLSLLTTFGTMCITTLLMVAAYILRGTTANLGNLPGVLTSSTLIVILMLSVSIPLQLKFGSDKSRVALLLAYGGVFLIGYLAVMLGKAAGIDVNGLVNKILALSPVFLIAGGCLLCVPILLLSYCASIRIMNKRQF